MHWLQCVLYELKEYLEAGDGQYIPDEYWNEGRFYSPDVVQTGTGHCYLGLSVIKPKVTLIYQ